VIGGVVEEVTREGEVLGSNPSCHVARDFMRKNAQLATSMETDGRLASGPSLELNLFVSIFKTRFFIFSIKKFHRRFPNRAACGNVFYRWLIRNRMWNWPISTGLQHRRC